MIGYKKITTFVLCCIFLVFTIAFIGLNSSLQANAGQRTDIIDLADATRWTSAPSSLTRTARYHSGTLSTNWGITIQSSNATRTASGATFTTNNWCANAYKIMFSDYSVKAEDIVSISFEVFIPGGRDAATMHLHSFDLYSTDSTGTGIYFTGQEVTYDEWYTITFTGEDIDKFINNNGYFNGFQFSVFQLRSSGVPLQHFTNYISKISIVRNYIEVPTLTKSIDYNSSNLSYVGTTLNSYKGIDYSQSHGISTLTHCGPSIVSDSEASGGSAVRFQIIRWSVFGTSVISIGQTFKASDVVSIEFKYKFIYVEGGKRYVDYSLFAPNSNGTTPVKKLPLNIDDDGKWVSLSLTENSVTALADSNGNISGFQFGGVDLSGTAAGGSSLNYLLIDYVTVNYVEDAQIIIDYPTEIYVKDDNNPNIIDFSVNNTTSIGTNYLTQYGGSDLNNFPITSETYTNLEISSVTNATNGNALRFKLIAGQLTQSYAVKFPYKIKADEFTSLVLRVMFISNSGSDNSTRDIMIYGYDSIGTSEQGIALDLETIGNKSWYNLILTQDDLLKISDNFGYISGLQVAGWRSDISSYNDYLYLDYFSYSVIDEGGSIILYDDEACEDFETAPQTINFLTDASSIAIGTNNLQYVNGYSSHGSVNELTYKNIEVISNPSSFNGSAYKLTFNSWALQVTNNPIIYDTSVKVTDILSISIRMYLHINTKPVYDWNYIYLYALDAEGWSTYGYSFTNLYQDQWVTLTLSGANLEKLADKDGYLRGLQIGSQIFSSIDDNCYVGEDNAYLLIDYISFEYDREITFVEDENVSYTVSVIPSSLQDNYYIPKKTGYIFKGWYQNDEQFNFTTYLTENITLNAKWVLAESIQNYTGLYVSALTGNRVMIFSDGNIDVSDKISSYDFYGIADNILYVSNNYKVKQFDLVNIFIPIDEYVTITWNVGNKTQKEMIASGTKIVPKTVTRNGYSFDKWVDEQNQDFDFDEAITSDLTLHSVWTMHEIGDYTQYLGFYYNSNNNNYIILLDNNIAKVYLSTLKFEGTYNILTNSAILFRYDNFEIEGTVYTMNIIRLLESNMQLTNEQMLIVSFDSNGGTAVSNSIVINNKVSQPNIPIRIGYIFNGWYYNDNSFDFNSSVMENIILVASWSIDPDYQPDNIYVYFNSNGGTAIDYAIVGNDGKITVPQSPVRENYTFIGWYYNGLPFNFNTIITDSIILEAVWNFNIYVYFDSNGGSEVSPVLVINKLISLPPNPVKNGYTFAGWYYQNDALFNISTEINSSFTLYAKWTQNKAPNNNNDNDIDEKGCGCAANNITDNGTFFISFALFLLIVLGCIGYRSFRRKE